MEGLFIFLGIFIFLGFKKIRPTERGIVERFGKYKRTCEQGLRWTIPFIDKMTKVNITEIRLDVSKQQVITKDNLNLSIDAVVYFKVDDVLKAIYKVNNYLTSIPSLAKTTLRAIIGEMNFIEVNAKRQTINSKIESELDNQTDEWGINILRVELQDVQPSDEVQDAMDKVVTAEREKEAKITRSLAEKESVRIEAEAKVIDAKAEKVAAIERATGKAEAVKLAADAKSKAIEMVNNSVEKTFKINAQKFKAMEVTENSLENNSKIILTEKGISPSLIINWSDDKVVPTPVKKVKVFKK